MATSLPARKGLIEIGKDKEKIDSPKAIERNGERLRSKERKELVALCPAQFSNS